MIFLLEILEKKIIAFKMYMIFVLIIYDPNNRLFIVSSVLLYRQLYR